jgi:hypothetical protein
MRTVFSAFISFLVTVCIVMVMALLVDPSPRAAVERSPAELVLTVGSASSQCNKKNQTIGDYLAANEIVRNEFSEASACRSDDECSLHGLPCSYGGIQAVNSSAIEELRDSIAHMEASSFVVIECRGRPLQPGVTIEGAQCIRGRCEIATSYINPFPRYEELYVPPVEGPISLEGAL